MKIDKRSEQSVYITINGWVYYIDDSTGEQIMEKWKETPSFGELDSSELIWLTIPHQLPPIAFWYEDKEKLVQGLHENEVREDLQYSKELEDFDKLMSEASMSYHATELIDKERYLAMVANEFAELGLHKKFKAIKQIEECAEVLGWKEGETA